MNKFQFKGSWNEIKGKLKQKYAQLTDGKSLAKALRRELNEEAGRHVQIALRSGILDRRDKVWGSANRSRQMLVDCL